jgi:DNA repair protein RecN (Recombination protein N)
LLSAQVEVQDVADELERIDSGISYDAERINTVNERLSAGYKLLKKHGVNSTQQLLEIQEELQRKLDAIFNISQSIEKTGKLVAKLFEEATVIAIK